MNLAQFEERLDHFGSDLKSWPEADRDEAARLIASNTRAKRVYEAALETDVLLDEVMAVRMPLGLKQRVLGQVPGRSTDYRGARWHSFIWKAFVAGVLPLMVGFSLGVADQDMHTDIEDTLLEVAYLEYSLDNGADDAS